MASLEGTTSAGQTDTPELAQILRNLTKNKKTAKSADLSQLEKMSWGALPRVKALGLIQLFDQAAQELLRAQIHGESSAVHFQVAQLYYRGKNFLPAISNLRRVFPNYLETPLECLPK